MIDVLQDFLSSINFFDIIVLIILIYNVLQCFYKGFSLSLISFSKWILSTIVTIILVPKLQPIVSEYIQSEFINNVGLGITIFIFTLFITIIIGKTLSKAVTWTGVGSIDKVFGFLFGFFKGYIVCVCLFSILNWFYPYQNWGISAEDAISFNFISKGSDVLINEFPSNEDFIDTKEKIEKFESDKLREECGIFGISNHADASALVALGLHALQHRGQEGCGIVSFDGKNYHSEKRQGLIGDHFTDLETLKKLPGSFAIGHNRYSTTGETSLRNIQPFFADLHMGGLSIAHNGNLTNAIVLRENLVKNGAIFRTTSDTETIVQLIARSKREKFIDKLIDTLFQIQGGYSLVLMTNKKLVGVRDPFGIRPLVVGKIKNSYIFASETCALDIVGASFVREVKNGEIVIVEDNQLKSIKPFPQQKARPCVFEYIYFARPDSLINNKCAYEYRKNLGTELAKEADLKADLVVPVPDSGVPAALGYAKHSKKNFELGLIRNHYVGRTFIEPTQNIRSLGVKLKLNSTKTIVKGKSIILIDDSLVRGTTCHKIVKMLYESGAKEVHVRIACPEIIYPDFYGVDMPTKEELLAFKKNNKEMCDYLNAKSLKFLSLEGLYKALINEKRDAKYPQFSDHYFTGDYPIKPHDNINGINVKQLSLLSGKSNN